MDHNQNCSRLQECEVGARSSRSTSAYPTQQPVDFVEAVGVDLDVTAEERDE